MPFRLVVRNARVRASAFCDQCGAAITDAALAHCAYPDTNRLLTKREGETYPFALLHKGVCTELYETKRGHVLLLELQTFLVRLGNDSLVDWAGAFELERVLTEEL